MNFIKSTTLSLIFISLMSFYSCDSSDTSQNDSKTDVNIAELITRSEKIRLGKEWDATQNSYAGLTRAINKNPHNNQAKLELAQLFIREARVTGEHGHYYPAALTILDQTLSDAELTEEMKFLALTIKAGVQLSLHDFHLALETGNKAAVLNPGNAQVHGVLIDANVELGNYQKAVQLSDRMLQIKPDIRSYSRASYLREIHGDIEGSIEAMHMAVKAGFPGTEETAWAMLTLGNIYDLYGYSEKAENIYKQILEVRENYPFAVGAIGDIQFKSGMYGQSEKTLKSAIDIIPEVGFYVSLAKVYKAQKRTDELQSITKEIMLMLQDDTDSGHNMNMEYADVYLELLEEPQKALEYASKEYKKRPKNIDVNRLMAKVYATIGDNEKVSFHKELASITNSMHPDLVLF